jgi:ribose transport system permease protein
MASATLSRKKLEVSSAKAFLKKNREYLMIFYLLIFVALAAAIFIPAFRTTTNIRNIFVQSISLGFVSIGQTFVMISGGFDLSVGSVISLASCLTSGLVNRRVEYLWPVLILVLMIGVTVGLLNGSLISNLKFSPFIATFASMSLVQGLTYLYTKRPPGGMPSQFLYFANGTVGPIPFPFLVFFVVLIVAMILLSKRRYGRYVYAVGSNKEFARLSGINTKKVLITTYIISSVMATVSAFFLTSRMGIGDPNIGTDVEINSITAVFLGGAMAGRGSVICTYAGVLILAMVANILNLLNVSSYWQMAFRGAILVAVVLRGFKQ